jgi:hypothetical protein
LSFLSFPTFIRKRRMKIVVNTWTKAECCVLSRLVVVTAA